MKQTNIYIYRGVNGTIQTPIQINQADEPSLIRLIAEDGMQLRNGDTTATVIDVATNDATNWSEELIPEPSNAPEQEA